MSKEMLEPDKIKEELYSLQDWTHDWLTSRGWGTDFTNALAIAVDIVILAIIAWIFYFIAFKLIRGFIKRRVKKSDNPQLDVFTKRNTFGCLAYFVPGILVFYLAPVFFNITEDVTKTVRIIAFLYLLVVFLMAVSRILHSFEYLAMFSEKYKRKPVSSYVQVIILMTYLFCGVLIVSVVFGKSPMTIITAFGAGMAIILLIFKDLILGLVASVQVSVNDMVRVGDWISVHNYNADGEITEMNLTTVKVRNWDKTISNVPTYALVSNGFRNVREMQDVGIRRLMHHILIDINSIKTVDEAFVQRLTKKDLFHGEVNALKWGKDQGYEFEQTTGLTNLGLFRRYIEQYITKHPGINNDYMVVRQLQQTGNGLPLEIYAFVNSVSFKPLNFVQSDIFEHLYAVIAEFELVPFQRPGSEDLNFSQVDLPLRTPE